VVLGPGYWTGGYDSSVTVTVTNTGNVPEDGTVAYALPRGVTDRGSADCTGGGCGVSGLAPGETRFLRIALRVAPDAWKGGLISGTASVAVSGGGASGSAAPTDWAVVFPAGPPVNGLVLKAGNAQLAPGNNLRTGMTAHLSNTGATPAAGSVQLQLPAGVTIATFPAACTGHSVVNPTTQRCDLGTVPAGGTVDLVFGLQLTPHAYENAPLASMLTATLVPPGLDPVTTAVWWQVLAAARTPGAVAALGISPGPGHSRAPAVSDSNDPGLIGGFADYAVAAYQVVGWKIVLISLIVLIGVLLGLALGLHQRRERPVPLFPAPLSGTGSGQRPDPGDPAAPTEPAVPAVPAAALPPLPRRPVADETAAAQPDARPQPRPMTGTGYAGRRVPVNEAHWPQQRDTSQV